jgi:hypothetical protein
MEQKSSMRDLAGRVRTLPDSGKTVVFDVVPKDFKILKQSAVQGNIAVWQTLPRHILATEKEKMTYDGKK